MYVDLNYRSRKKMPIGYSQVGGIVDSMGLRMVLVRDDARGGQYFGMINGSLYDLDQYAVCVAVKDARSKAPAPPLAPARPLARAEPMGTYCVRLDELAATTLRAYGGGNLSAGIREAAKFFVNIA